MSSDFAMTRIRGLLVRFKDITYLSFLLRRDDKRQLGTAYFVIRASRVV